MAYMVWQQYTTAILEAYGGHDDAPRHLESARSHRRWLESLDLPANVKTSLVEHARAVEEAFEKAAAHPG